MRMRLPCVVFIPGLSLQRGRRGVGGVLCSRGELLVRFGYGSRESRLIRFQIPKTALPPPGARWGVTVTPIL